jgi:hypothetical protein
MSPPHVASRQSLRPLGRTVPRPQLTPHQNPNHQPRLSQGTSSHLNAKRSSAAFRDAAFPTARMRIILPECLRVARAKSVAAVHRCG